MSSHFANGVITVIVFGVVYSLLWLIHYGLTALGII